MSAVTSLYLFAAPVFVPIVSFFAWVRNALVLRVGMTQVFLHDTDVRTDHVLEKLRQERNALRKNLAHLVADYHQLMAQRKTVDRRMTDRLIELFEAGELNASFTDSFPARSAEEESAPSKRLSWGHFMRQVWWKLSITIRRWLV